MLKIEKNPQNYNDLGEVCQKITQTIYSTINQHEELRFNKIFVTSNNHNSIAVCYEMPLSNTNKNVRRHKYFFFGCSLEKDIQVRDCHFYYY